MSDKERRRAFAVELHELCQRHNLSEEDTGRVACSLLGMVLELSTGDRMYSTRVSQNLADRFARALRAKRN